ncbi:MAG: polysaccharide deacetylase family protein [Romboutsia sp.]
MRKDLRRAKAFISSFSFFVLTIGLIVALICGMKYIYSTQGNSKMPIYKVDTEDKKVALTFDVAWGSDNMEYIMKTLDKHNVKSTFFLVGSWIDDNKELVEKLDKKGHELSNHSNTHANMTKLSEEDIAKEIEVTTDKIYNITGKKTDLYRPPFGDVDNEAMSICKSLGYKVIKWNIDSMDWKEIGPMHVTERVIKGVEPGSIVLLHANVSDIEKYLDDIITILKKDGYELVTISDLIYQDNYIIDSNGVQKTIKK